MGRGRGKGKKLMAVTTHDDLGGGDEVFPVYKRRGRPQKPLKEDAVEKEAGKIEEEEGGNVITTILETEVQVPITLENGKKRKWSTQMKEDASSVLEEDRPNMRSSLDDSTRSNGFRQNGSRRKSTPRRAAEAGVVAGHTFYFSLLLCWLCFLLLFFDATTSSDFSVQYTSRFET